jgi:flagellar biosynthesis/type III secretory pathway protein FliH
MIQEESAKLLAYINQMILSKKSHKQECNLEVSSHDKEVLKKHFTI